MTTINISLPISQSKQIDELVGRYGFANRSEFIRSMLRMVMRSENLIEQAVSYPFISPQKGDVKTVVTAFSKTGKYSLEFLNDLEEGMQESDYYAKT